MEKLSFSEKMPDIGDMLTLKSPMIKVFKLTAPIMSFSLYKTIMMNGPSPKGQSLKKKLTKTSLKTSEANYSEVKLTQTFSLKLESLISYVKNKLPTWTKEKG